MQDVKREIFRPPRGGKANWFKLLAGVVGIAYGLVSLSTSIGGGTWVSGLIISTIGFMLVFMGGAELMPSDRRIPSGLLRIGAAVSTLMVLVWMVLATVVWLS